MKKYTYFIEGETEEKLVKHLASTGKINGGKVTMFNFWEKDAGKILRLLNRKDNVIYIVFDTDVLSAINRFNDNLKKLSKDNSIKSIFLMQQTKNLEDELVFCCSCTKSNLFSEFSSSGATEFKNKFNKVTNVGAKLASLGFECEKLWVQNLNTHINKPASKAEIWGW